MPNRTLEQLISDEKERALDAGELPKLKDLTDDLEKIASAGQLFNSELNLEELVQKVTDSGVEITGAEFGSFFYNQTNEQENALKLFTVSGADREDFANLGRVRATALLSPHETPEGVIRIADLEGIARMPKGHLPARSYMAVPVVTSDGRSAGVLLFGHKQPNMFDERSERLAKGVAVQAAVAIDNASLYRSAQREIVRRTEVEKTLRESEAHYRARVEFSPQVPWTADPDGMLIEVHPRWTEWTGKPGTGQGWADAIHPDDVERSFAAWHSSIETGQPYDIDHRAWFQETQSYRWIHSRAYPRRDGDKIIKWYGLTEDIHDRKMAEEAIRDSEHRFRLIADSAPIPMWVTGLDHKRMFVNKAYMEFLGTDDYEAARLANWAELIHPEDRDRLIKQSLAGEATLKPFSLEARYKRCDGEYRWLKSQSQPRWGINGEHVGFHGVAHDVTDAKEAEAKLRRMNETLEQKVLERTRELEETHQRLLSEINERQIAQAALMQSQKMESVGQLTGGVAHDFNNMLQIMMGNLELIKMQAARVEEPKTADKINRYVGLAMEGANKAATLTSQLLAFSRKTRLKIDKVDANEVVPNVVEMISRSIGKDIAVQTELEPDLWNCLSDRSQLQVALVNLALNARDAMPQGGKICIKTENRTMKSRKFLPGARCVAVSVSDDGVGIPAEDLERVFEPFFTTKPTGKGTGLGLSMVYGFCQQANGKVEIESTVGKGTTVTMLFPYTKGERNFAEDEHLLDEQPAKGPATVLVVDDEPGVRELAVNLLDSLGYNTIHASSADEALQVLEGGLAIDLVFSDVVMPGSMDGFGLASRIKETWPDLPVILATGHAEVLLNGQVPEQLRNLKILGKPYRTADLSQCVADVLETAKAA